MILSIVYILHKLLQIALVLFFLFKKLQHQMLDINEYILPVTILIILIVDYILFRKRSFIFQFYFYFLSSSNTNIFKKTMRTMLKQDTKTNDDLKSSLFNFQKVNHHIDSDDDDDDDVINNIYSCPSNRSGHRAVYNELDSNIYIWGGYCPINQNLPISIRNSPMYPEVCIR